MLTGLHHRDEWWERRVLPSLPLACQTSALLMSYAPDGVPSRTFTSNLMLRTHLLCDLSYGDQIGARVR